VTNRNVEARQDSGENSDQQRQHNTAVGKKIINKTSEKPSICAEMCFKSKAASYMICDLEIQVKSEHGILVGKSGVKRPLIKLKTYTGR
jgi:hypothetical protein